ncbi:MAG: hypothetical protein ACXVP0_17270 [Bacteroidia bacterium]
MRAASINELKKELQELEPARLAELCISLAKYKKDNKELLGYLLFESHDTPGFITQVKSIVDEHFNELATQSNLYYAKKTLRKILRIVNKYIRYIGDKESAAELLIYFCTKLKRSDIPIHKSVQLTNLFNQQIKKINAILDDLHPDLAYDYKTELDNLNE